MHGESLAASITLVPTARLECVGTLECPTSPRFDAWLFVSLLPQYEATCSRRI
jgi:hypothetical protein